MQVLLPLFPLETVLLPGAPLLLHIFEPRYKEMIGECLEQKKEFGVLRAKEEGVLETGCTAEIVKVIKQYEDGRMDLVSVGRRRFEVMEIIQERSFLQGHVLYVEDEPAAAEDTSELRRRALDLFRQVATLIGQEGEADEESAQLSFQLAGVLPIDLDFKQALLGIRSESKRLTGLVEFFDAVLPMLKKAARRREKAGGNGHVP